MGGFEILEHTADVGVRAWGATVEQAFEQATKAVAGILGAWRPGPGRTLAVTVEASDRGGLLVDWLNEVLYLQETEGPALGGVSVDRVGDTRAEGSLVVRAQDPAPPDGIEVKAATYHRLGIEEDEDGWVVEVYLDV